MTVSIGYAVDLSHHNDPARVPWAEMQGKVDAVICRAGYGALLRDRQVVAHSSRARSIGARVGLYLFFRPIHPVAAQLELLERVADDVSFGDGSVAPALDVEDDPFSEKVSPAWAGPVQEMLGRMVEKWGEAMLYLSQWEWVALGSPAWAVDRPLWVPHYTPAPAPRSPGGALPTLWQHRVAPFDPSGPGGAPQPQGPAYVDQSRILKPLPIVGEDQATLIDEAEADRIQGLVALTLSESARDDGEAPARNRAA